MEFDKGIVKEENPLILRDVKATSVFTGPEFQPSELEKQVLEKHDQHRQGFYIPVSSI